MERPSDAGHTLVGTLDDTAPARVDRAGGVQADGAAWSIDWWIGGDDRWYFPCREATVRQQRLGAGPLIATSVRIPSGDAVQRCYPVSIGGRSATVVEIENDSPVPVALALAVRPYTLDGSPSHGSVNIDDRRIMVGDQVALCLPRRANERLATNRDASDVVSTGSSLSGAAEVAGETPNGVVLYPLPHRTKLRFVVPAVGGGTIHPDEVPDLEAVQRGWTAVVDGGGRFSFPDNGITQRASGARARLLIGTREVPSAVATLEPGAGRWLAGLAASGNERDVRMALLALASAFPARLPSSPGAAAAIVGAAGTGLAMMDDRDLADDVLGVLVQITHLVERAGDRSAAGEALRGLGWALVAADQPDPARELLARSIPLGVGRDLVAGLDDLTVLGEQGSAAGSWHDDDPVDAARFWLGARGLVLTEDVDGVDLLPGFPTAWRGGGVEVHGAATVHGRVSFAVRWHGYRPALLWDVEAHRPFRLRCSGLDAGWSTIESKGEVLLEGAADELPAPPSEGDSFL